MVALKYHQIYNHNLNKLMEWTTEIIEQPAATCTFKTEAPARCIRGQRPDSFPTVKLKGYEVNFIYFANAEHLYKDFVETNYLNYLV